jgi:hypothetical protein
VVTTLTDLQSPAWRDGERYHVLAADANEPDYAARLNQLLLESPSVLVALYTKNTPEILKALETYTRRNAQSIYSWTMDRGFVGLREDSFVVPATRRIPDAIRHVQASVHFGTYLISASAVQFTPPLIAQLRQMARAQDGITKRLVFISEDGNLPASLTEYCAHIQLQPRSAARLRLRDGRWIR